MVGSFAEPEPTHVVSGAAFAFYSAEEILRTSVKEVTVPTAFDPLGHPIPECVGSGASRHHIILTRTPLFRAQPAAACTTPPWAPRTRPLCA